MSRRSYTDDELDRCWYTPDELLGILDDIDEIVRGDHRRGGGTSSDHDDDDDDCTHRGLERCFLKGKLKMKKRVRRASMAVMAMQEIQMEESGELDAEEIADVYLDFTEESTQEALRIAQQDAIDARRTESSSLSSALCQKNSILIGGAERCAVDGSNDALSSSSLSSTDEESDSVVSVSSSSSLTSSSSSSSSLPVSSPQTIHAKKKYSSPERFPRGSTDIAATRTLMIIESQKQHPWNTDAKSRTI
eukprot:CAMPEP_0119567244 /NCGR_PEP_ID=MMETSP1352-20130426/35376_1 /TAXON_ID=265584 /ORGANISM="Stauroneis constricta, Strain CCMP1120" /LENGTH=247 /DNA_ID=CAMNT_0007616481 /DNA_START=410 /DNA_END=1153 /DNA_ORIENTATION=+